MNDDERKLDNLLAALDEAWPREGPAMEEELRQVGLEQVLVRARMRTVANAARNIGLESRHPKPTPDPLPLPWVRRAAGGWVCDPAVAGQSREDRSWFCLDFTQQQLSGKVQVLVHLRSEADGSHALHLEWESGFYCEQGWHLELYRAQDRGLVFSRNLGPGYRGSVALSSDDLGLDPAQVPLLFSFQPDRKST